MAGTNTQACTNALACYGVHTLIICNFYSTVSRNIENFDKLFHESFEKVSSTKTWNGLINFFANNKEEN
jgi:hypothetical protein